MSSSTMNDNAPESLYDLCLATLVVHREVYSNFDPVTYNYTIKEGIRLPEEICENILSVTQERFVFTDELAHAFSDNNATKLRSVKVTSPRITHLGVSYLVRHSPCNIELINCEMLRKEVFDVINDNSKRLKSLKIIGPLNKLITYDLTKSIDAPKLRKLIINQQHLPLISIVSNITAVNLAYLDLSECTSANFYTVKNIPNLEYLIFYNVHWLHEVMEWIMGLRKLKHLDIAQCDERFGTFESPDEVLAHLIDALPNLESLDISGTNLAGTGAPVLINSIDRDVEPQYLLCDIPGLASRMNRPLHYLGLYGVAHGACKRNDIPAKVISGDANEDQVLAAATVNYNRPDMMLNVLNDLFHLSRSEGISKTWVALSIVLDAMEKYTLTKHIQIAGSACLFYVAKGKEKKNISYKLKKRMIAASLQALQDHPEDDIITRNCCLTICQFHVPQDVLFVYERLSKRLLEGLTHIHTQDTFVLRIVIYLLNSLACQVERRFKQFLGDCGAVAHMLLVISNRLDRYLCDDVLEVAWSTVWNVTDETPQNCLRFLDGKGMNFFILCRQRFPDKAGLLRNMMGLLGNVAEVYELRPRLMCDAFISIFYELLYSTCDGIEVSYNAAGVLVHIASDGPEAWTAVEPERDAVLRRLQTVLEAWDLRAHRNINYRCFEPILRLLRVDHTPQCQHWAAWALANLTTVYPEKYCKLVEEEEGFFWLKRVIASEEPYLAIKELAQLVLDNCASFERGDHGAQVNDDDDMETDEN